MSSIEVLRQRLWDRLSYLSQALRVGMPWYNDEGAWQQLERQVQVALSPVSAPTGFRRSLADDLAMAAQGQRAGLAVEYPRRLRERVILGVSAGLVAATLGAISLVLYTHLRGAER